MQARQRSCRTKSALMWAVFFVLWMTPPLEAQEMGDFEESGAAEAMGQSLPAANTFTFTGAATAKVPIAVPAGRNGIAPNLALTYNSYRRNGWVGVGWDLDLGAIKRSTKRAVDYQADEFVAAMAGSTVELVPRPQWGPDVYGAKIEGAFTQYRFNAATGWEVTSRDGVKYFYGSTVDSRQADPEDGGRVFKWCLDRVQDPHGNYMSVSYRTDRGQIYPDRIEYTGGSGLLPYHYVQFHLEDRRPDVWPVYGTNFAVATALRLKSIEVGNAAGLVRAYALTYTVSDSTQRSLLSRVQQFGSDAEVFADGTVAGGSFLPPITFQWQTDGSNTFSQAYYSGSGIAGFSLQGEEDRALGFDYNGDGKTDLFLYRPGTHAACVGRSNGDGTFSQAYYSSQGIGGYQATSFRLKAVAFDYDGDGRTDLFLYDYPLSSAGVIRSNEDGTFEAVYVSSTGMAGYPLTSSLDLVIPFDYNGDGKSDLFICRPNRNLACVVRSNGDGTFTRVYYHGGGIGAYNLTSERDRVFAFDYNGDGKSDLFLYRVDSDKACVLRSNGDGSFTTVFNSDSGIAGYSLGSLRDVAFPFDYNGDGKSDIFLYRLDSGYCAVAVSRGDGTFEQAYYSHSGINGFTMGSERDRVLPFDYNGDGRSDLFMYRQDGGLAYVQRSNGDGTFEQVMGSNSGIGGYDLLGKRDQVFSFDYNGDGKGDLFLYRPDSGNACVVRSGGDHFPDLLAGISNGAGGSATFGYTPSSRYPNQVLPFIVHPVSRKTVNDGLGNTSTIAYAYADGRFDYLERDFRGFGYVEETNLDGTVGETWFHQDEFYKGRQSMVQFRERHQGPILTRTTFTWDKAALTPSEAVFVKLAAKRSESYDAETVCTQEDYTYDEVHGGLARVVTSGSGAETVTKDLAYLNYGDWLWRMTRETLEGSVSGKVRETYFGHEQHTGNLISKEFWLKDGTNPVVRMQYDDYGNLEYQWDALGNRTRTEYDDETHTVPKRVTNPLGHVVEYTYDEVFADRIASVIDQNGNETTYSHDAFGRPWQTSLPDGGQVTVEYHEEALPRYVVQKGLENGTHSTIDTYRYFDGLGRGIQTISLGEAGKPIVTRTRYNAMGRVDKSWGPFFSTFIGYHGETDIPGNIPYAKTDYDLRGRPTRIESPLGEDVDSAATAVTTLSYSGLSTTTTDPDGGKKGETKDYLGRIIEVTEYADTGLQHTHHDYNAAGDLLKLTDALGNITTISYDKLGRKTSMQDPDMGYWRYGYDANGNLNTQTDAKGQTVTFTYDGLNRVKSKTYSTGDPAVTYTYDSTAIENGIGRLYQVKNANAGTTIERYDAMGRELRVTRRITGAPRSSYTTSYAYDEAGRLTSVVYPDGFRVNYQYYEGTGLIEGVVGISEFEEYAAFEDYEPGGQIGLIYHGNQTATAYDYDSKSTRLLSIQTMDRNLAGIQSRFYKYTPAGNIRQIIESNPSETNTRIYAYDKLHRIRSETGTTGPGPIVPAAVTKIHDSVKPIHAVKSVVVNGAKYSYQYDANGNMTQGPDLTDPKQVGKRAFTYNADNMPIRIVHTRGSTSKTLDLYYDTDGSRVKKVVQGAGTTFYVGDHFEVAGGVEIKYVFAGSLRIAKVISNTAQFYHKDHLGSTTVMTDDPNGLAMETAGYLPFGLMRNHSGSDVTYYRFTDQEYDAQVGLYHFNARLYDPAIGIFITPDSIIPKPYDPQTLNRYSYCRNNPLFYVDPSGHFPWAAVIAGAVFGAIGAGVQSDWNPEATLAGAVIGGISGGVFSGVSGAVGPSIAHIGLAGGVGPPTAGMMMAGQIGGAIAGGAAAGATAGALGAGYYGGNIAESIARGAGFGALGGLVFGAIGSYYDGRWGLDRVVVHGLAGAALAVMQGGEFWENFALTGGAAAAMMAWQYMERHTDASSLSGRHWSTIRHHPTDGRLDTIAERNCVGDCRWSLSTGVLEGSAKFFESEFGRYINLVSKAHDFSLAWSKNSMGFTIGRGPFINPIIGIYSYAGMIPSAVYTSYAFSSAGYQPFIKW